MRCAPIDDAWSSIDKRPEELRASGPVSISGPPRIRIVLDAGEDTIFALSPSWLARVVGGWDARVKSRGYDPTESAGWGPPRAGRTCTGAEGRDSCRRTLRRSRSHQPRGFFLGKRSWVIAGWVEFPPYTGSWPSRSVPKTPPPT